jgi:hypothetical protein
MSDDLDAGLKDVLAERGRVDPAAVDRVLARIDELPARSAPRWRGPGWAMAAVVVLAVVAVGLVALLRPSTDVATTPAPVVPSASPPATTEPAATLQAPPVWAVQLASHLDCDGLPSTIGSDTENVPRPVDPASSPEEALVTYLRRFPSLPATGYVRPLVSGHWALHRLMVDGRPKVHAVSTDQYPDDPAATGWTVVGLRACDPSELGS